MLYYGARFDLGLAPHSYALLLVSTASGSVSSAILGSLVAGSLTSGALLAFGGSDRRRAAPDDHRARPVGICRDPDRSGGTESAMRR